MIDTRLLNEIKQHAMDCYPNEACGFIVVNKYKLALTIKCRNDSPFPKTQFLINPDEYLRAEQEGEIVGVWHTHTNGNPKPTESDLAGCEVTGLPWYMLMVEKKGDEFHFNDLVEFSPTGYEAPYEGRPYVYGSFDCWTLCRDFYQREFGIELRDYPRVEKFWTNEETNYFINKYEEVGLVDVTNQPLQYGDILFIQTDNSGNPNHSAIYVGTEKILHHCEGRLSRYDAYVYGSYWLKHTVKQMRHNSKC
ncbi:C40 family peptidase [Acinetobacter baumannii]